MTRVNWKAERKHTKLSSLRLTGLHDVGHRLKWFVMEDCVHLVRYMRLYTDDQGESHFDDVEVSLRPTDFAPPADPTNLSAYTSATRWAFFHLPKDWYGDWHPTPCRQFFFCLQGAAEITASDGEVRRLCAGDTLLVEDTTGKGHLSRAIDECMLAAVVQLPD
jgi:hypothetical protein